MWARVEVGVLEVVLVCSLFWIAVVVLMFRVPRYWRGVLNDREKEVLLSGVSGDVRRAFVRTLILVFITSVVFALGTVPIIWTRITGHGLILAPTWMQVVMILWGAWMLIIYPILSYAVIYRNVPKWIVPPSYRDEPGVNELRRRRGELGRYRRQAFIRFSLVLFGAAAVVVVLVVAKS